MTIQNPYNAEGPVKDANMFFGREHELTEIIDERIKHSHPISTILIGGRKIGKTSLLYQVRHRLLEQPQYNYGVLVPAYISLHASSYVGISAVFGRITSAITRSLRRKWGLPISSSGDIEGDPYHVLCRRMLEIWNECAEHIGTARFVMLIDEAERLLGNPWTEDLFCNLRDLINSSELTPFVSIVITGFRELHDYAMVEQEGIGSIWGNAARWTSLSVLTEKECKDLITIPINGELQEEVVKAVYEQSGGHPLITQYLMQQIWKSDPTSITVSDVTRSSEGFSSQIKVFQSWEAKFTDLDRQVYHVLAGSRKALALGEIQKLVNDKVSKGDTKDSLDFLCYTGVVSKQDKRYLAAGCLFRDWFTQRSRKEDKAMNNSKQDQEFDITRLVISALVVIVLFVVTFVALVWAAKQVPTAALVFIFIIAVIFNLIGIVTILVMNGFLRKKWAMDFYNAVLNKVFPILKLSLPHQTAVNSKGNQDIETEGKPDK